MAEPPPPTELRHLLGEHPRDLLAQFTQPQTYQKERSALRHFPCEQALGSYVRFFYMLRLEPRPEETPRPALKMSQAPAPVDYVPGVAELQPAMAALPPVPVYHKRPRRGEEPASKKRIAQSRRWRRAALRRGQSSRRLKVNKSQLRNHHTEQLPWGLPP